MHTYERGGGKTKTFCILGLEDYASSWDVFILYAYCLPNFFLTIGTDPDQKEIKGHLCQTKASVIEVIV